MTMITALEFADRIGRRAMADALNVGLTAVSNNVVKGSYPSSWYLALKRLADDAAVECPPALFRMKEGRPSQDVDADADCKSNGKRQSGAVA